MSSVALKKLALAGCFALLAALVVPAAAANATAYRYWGYFSLKGTTWTFSQKGPDQTKPADGSVEGWRFAVGTTGSTRTPRATPTFAQVCHGTPAASGKKRVAVVIDYGRPADSANGTTPPAPVAKCASVDVSASGAEVLGAVANVRTQNGMICGVNNLPATGCGDTVKKVTAAMTAPDQPVKLDLGGHQAPAAGHSSGPGTGTWVGIGVVVLAALGLGGTALARRRQA